MIDLRKKEILTNQFNKYYLKAIKRSKIPNKFP